MNQQMPQLESKVIMIVEDSEDDFEAAQRALRKVGVTNHIHWCKTAMEALHYLNDKIHALPGLIIMDLNMPGITGKSALEAIKKTSDLRSIPVIILTTSSDTDDVNDCYDLGANSYIQKPVNYENLILAMQSLKEYWFDTAILPKAALHA